MSSKPGGMNLRRMIRGGCKWTALLVVWAMTKASRVAGGLIGMLVIVCVIGYFLYPSVPNYRPRNRLRLCVDARPFGPVTEFVAIDERRLIGIGYGEIPVELETRQGRSSSPRPFATPADMTNRYSHLCFLRKSGQLAAVPMGKDFPTSFVDIRRVDDLTLVSRHEVHEKYCDSVVYNHIDDSLVTRSFRSVRIWHLPDMKCVADIFVPDNLFLNSELVPQQGGCLGVYRDLDTEEAAVYFVSASGSELQFVQHLSTRDEPIRFAEISPGGGLVAAKCVDQAGATLRVHSLRENAGKYFNLEGPDLDDLASIVFSSSESLAAGTYHHTAQVAVWNLQTRETVLIVRGFRRCRGFLGLCLPDDSTLLVCDDTNITLWNLDADGD